MKLEQAIAILRRSGWSVDVDKESRRIVLKDPLPDEHWLHVLRHKAVSDIESVRGVNDSACRNRVGLKTWPQV